MVSNSDDGIYRTTLKKEYLANQDFLTIDNIEATL